MRMMSGCFTWFPNYLVLGEPNIYHHLWYFTRKWEWSRTGSNPPIGVFEWKTEAI